MSRVQSCAIDAAVTTAFRDDGVVFLPGSLTPDTLALARSAYDWSLANPGPDASKLPSRGSGAFYQDLANPRALERYRPLVADTGIADLVAGLFGGGEVWFMYEQVFTKTGGPTRRTPWHQDAPYLPVRGDDLVVLWISFDSVPAEQALEFVRGSHRGTVYDGSRFDPDDDTAPIYGDGSLPRLPDIESARDNWPIVSWATRPGDVIAFHPAVLHGGGATTAEISRHALSLRFFGADAMVAARPEAAPVEDPEAGIDPEVHPLTRMRRLPDGSPFRDSAFPQLRP